MTPNTHTEVPPEAVELANAAILKEVEDKLSWNLRAYGKARTGEGEDAEFIVGDSARLALAVALPSLHRELREPLQRILACCQEVAHEVEEPTHACAEIEEIVRAALQKGDQ